MNNHEEVRSKNLFTGEFTDWRCSKIRRFSLKTFWIDFDSFEQLKYSYVQLSCWYFLSYVLLTPRSLFVFGIPSKVQISGVNWIRILGRVSINRKNQAWNFLIISPSIRYVEIVELLWCWKSSNLKDVPVTNQRKHERSV